MRMLLALMLMAAPALAGEWQTYGNPRYGFSLELPSKSWVAQPDPENGDGRSWISSDGRSSLMAWGNQLIDGSFRDDAESRLASDQEAGWTITYRKGHNLEQKSAGPSWMAYSGRREDRVLYVRSRASCGGTQAVHVRLEYPKEEQDIYGPMLTRITQTLTGNDARDCR